ncbi:MAG: YraN family protein [Alphaproteobacteria bacterium]|nr:YraN family protein [Alphaproteobacteria bacterium]
MRSSLNLKKRAYFKGKRAEWIAARYLQLKGYEILEKRFKTPLGEIDLLARKGTTLVAIEVKARKTREQAVMALTSLQKRRIEKALLFYLSGKTSCLNLRFDVILISPWRWPYHIRGAWITQ